MNTPSPLVPQGTIQNGKSTLRVAVFSILVIHVALIGGFLFQGCSKKTPTDEMAYIGAETNIVESATNEPAIAPLDTNAAIATASNTMATPEPIPAASAYVSPTAPVTPAVTTPVAPVQPVAPVAGTEYFIVKGDTLAKVAKKHGVSLKALQEANPGVDSSKLKIKQKIIIPAAGASVAAATTSTGAEVSAPAAESSVYTVKAGDALAKIAKQHGVSVNAIVALNNLKSKNAIKPGQKLKMPAPKTAPAPAAGAEVPVAPVAPVMPTAPISAPVAAPIQ